jgi:hypothetical protein
VQGENQPLHPYPELWVVPVSVKGAASPEILTRSVLAFGCAPLRLPVSPLTLPSTEFVISHTFSGKFVKRTVEYRSPSGRGYAAKVS